MYRNGGFFSKFPIISLFICQQRRSCAEMNVRGKRLLGGHLKESLDRKTIDSWRKLVVTVSVRLTDPAF